MYQKALVAVDGSKPSLRAVETVRELAKKKCVEEVTLVNIINIPHAGVSAEGLCLDFVPSDYQKELIRAAKQVIEKAAEIMGPGLSVKKVIETGPPAETILQLLEKGNFDLVIMGNRGLNPFERLLMGSVSNRVVTLAHCTVIVVK